MKLTTAAILAIGLFGNAFAQADDRVVFVVDSAADGLLQTPVTPQWHGQGFGQDWRHLQVKDSQGNSVPFRFVQHVPQPSQAIEDKPLPLFFLTGAEEGAPRTVAPAIIRVTPETIEIMMESSQTRPATPTNQYLVDLRDMENKPSTLVLDWHGDEANRIYPLTLQYSDDLTHWQSAGQYTLTKLIANDTRLEQNTLELPRHVADHAYLKLRFDPSAKIVINTLYGRHVSHSQAAAEVMQWSVTGALASSQTRAALGRHDRSNAEPVTAWEYQRSEQAPAASVLIDFQDRPFIGEVRILAKSPADPYWQPVKTAVWHHIRHQDRWYSSTALPLYQHTATQWRLETTADGNPQAAPALRFSAPQWHFQLLANGNSPYSLVRTDAADFNKLNQMREVFASLGLDNESPVTEAAITSESTPESALTPAPTDSHHWQYLAFWLLLIGATVVMLYFVVRLFRAQKIQPP